MQFSCPFHIQLWRLRCTKPASKKDISLKCFKWKLTYSPVQSYRTPHMPKQKRHSTSCWVLRHQFMTSPFYTEYSSLQISLYTLSHFPKARCNNVVMTCKINKHLRSLFVLNSGINYRIFDLYLTQNHCSKYA